MGLASTSSWQVRIAGMHATGGWDHFASRGTFEGNPAAYISNRAWPLFHLAETSGDSNRTIEFLADCGKRGFRVRLRTGSGSPADFPFAEDLHYWYPDSPLYVTIAFNASANALIVGASLGGDEVRTVSISNPFGETPPTFSQLQFRSTPVEGSEVIGFRWFGGDYDPSPATVPTEAKVKESWSSLSFLE
jgi:hypothetical protein